VPGHAADRVLRSGAARPVRTDPQILRPRRKVHLGSASLAGNSVDVAITSALTGMAVQLIYTPTTGPS
jgi:hypothetical protein